MITIISTQKFLITITIMIIFLKHFWLRLNYDYKSINFPDYNYNYDYEKIDYNRNQVIRAPPYGGCPIVISLSVRLCVRASVRASVPHEVFRGFFLHRFI
jgi:hypothetical protein